jgi:DNA-directed RNA polymerase specialized sigma24 family protein
MPHDPFPRTSWTLVAHAGAPLSPAGQKAMDLLCEAYWAPVYAFIRGRAGSEAEARDLTQGFFAYLLAKNDLATVSPARGKFRAWLLGCVKHYLANQRDHDSSVTHRPPGGFVSLETALAEERYQAETAGRLTPERLFLRAFAMNVLDRALGRVRARYAAAGKEARFEELKGTLTESATLRSYKEVGSVLGMDEGAVKKAAFDLRALYRRELRDEVKGLVEDPDDEAAVDEELRQLLEELTDPEDPRA